MRNFIFHNQTKIIFGKGQIQKTGREVAAFGKKVLMVYGRGSIKQNGIYDQVVASLHAEHLTVIEFPGVKSNPVLSHTRKGIDLAKREGVDVVLAVGGGSVIDSAKTIAAGAKTDDDVWDYFVQEKKIQAALPILTVVNCFRQRFGDESGSGYHERGGLQKVLHHVALYPTENIHTGPGDLIYAQPRIQRVQRRRCDNTHAGGLF